MATNIVGRDHAFHADIPASAVDGTGLDSYVAVPVLGHRIGGVDRANVQLLIEATFGRAMQLARAHVTGITFEHVN